MKRETKKKIILFLNSIMPKSKKKIVLESYPDFTDNALEFYEYLTKHGKRKYKFIWVVDDINVKKEKNMILVNKENKFKYMYHVFTSKNIFYGNKGVIFFNCKKQNVVNMTHGLPFKTSKGLMQKDEDFTHLISSSDLISPIMANEFDSKVEKCIVTGLPRNDVLFLENNEVNDVIKDFDKFILWLPTYKKHKAVDKSIIDNYTPVPLFNNEDLQELNKDLKEKNMLLILKFHPAQDLSLLDSESLTNIYLWKNEDLVNRNLNLYKLMSKSDALITDYSSVSADYLLLDRPIAYVQDDMEEFTDKRGFCFENIDEMSPGDKIKTKEDFAKFINKIYNNEDTYKSDRKRVRDFYHKYQDGTSSKVLADYFDL